ncbi:MAG TPA: hypothetical protein EYG82_02360 [Sulfurovum sp.]|nr:hypothetical protein [Sulfurovum sp.]
MVDFDRRKIENISFHENEVKLAKTAMDKLRTTIEFFYYLMEYRDKKSFTMIMISAEDLLLKVPLKKWKRQSDVLIEIDPVLNVYVIISQSTDSEGGKRFAEILLSNIDMNGGEGTYCVETDVTSTEHAIQEVIFKMVEKYMRIKQEEKSNQVHIAYMNDADMPKEEEISYFKD